MKQNKADALRSAMKLALACAGLAGAAFCTTAAVAADEPQSGRLQPRLGIDLMWVDNLDLAPPGAPKSDDYIGQVTPGLRYQQDTRRLRAYLDYQAQALFFNDDSDRDEVVHHGHLSGDLTVVEDWLFVGVDGSYFQSIVDPERPVNENNLFNVGNSSDTAAGRIVPRLKHRFGDAEFEAHYANGFVDYRDDASTGGVPLDDSRNEDARAELRGANREALITWAASWNYEHVEYDISAPFEYERADVELGLRLAPGFRLIGRGGLESDPFDVPADGGLEESTWSGGFSWQYGPRTELRLLVGERFFGTSVEAALKMQGRVLNLELNYDELPTTEAQRVAMQDVQAPDPTLPSTDLGPVYGRPSAEVYLLKRFHMQLGAVGRVTRVGLELISEDREYQQSDDEDKVNSGRLFLSRSFGQRTDGEISTRFTDADLRSGNSYQDALYELRISRQLGTRTSMHLAGTYLDRSGDIQEYKSTWVSVGVQMTF